MLNHFSSNMLAQFDASHITHTFSEFVFQVSLRLDASNWAKEFRDQDPMQPFPPVNTLPPNLT